MNVYFVYINPWFIGSDSFKLFYNKNLIFHNRISYMTFYNIHG